MTNFGDLPKDLANEILSLVPATDLKRIRPTCKDMNRLFNDKSFATKHFDTAPKEFLALMLTNDHMLCPMSVNLHGDIPSVEVKSKLTLVDPDSSNSSQFEILQVIHCDGLLLCTSRDNSRVVIWNPCTGQTRGIKAGNPGKLGRAFLLGYCQDEKSSGKSYKIVKFYTSGSKDAAIYELSSDSWRTLDYNIAPGLLMLHSDHYVSLKGDAYMFARDEKTPYIGHSSMRFDFQTEKFAPVSLPYEGDIYFATSLSVVREEKIFMLLQVYHDAMTEIWVSNKIDETKLVSWSKVGALDFYSFDIPTWYSATFLLDEEKKILLMCDTWSNEDETVCQGRVYIFSDEYSKVTPYNSGVDVDAMEAGWPTILNYVTSLVQIEGAGGNIRKTGE